MFGFKKLEKKENTESCRRVYHNLRANDAPDVRLGKAYCDITEVDNDIGEDICVAHDTYAIVFDHWSRPWTGGGPVAVVSCENGVGWIFEDEYVVVETT